MASDEATVKMTGDDREAAAMWNRQIQAVTRLDNKLDKLGQQGLRAGQGMAGGFQNALLKVFALERGISAITSGLAQMSERVRDFDKARANATASRADTFADFKNVAGITNRADAARAKATLNRIAVDVGADDPKMVDLAASALASSGFDTKEVIDRGGAEALMSAYATAGLVKAGFDPTENTQAISKVMESTGQKMTAENLAKNANQIAMLKQKGVLEFEHLPELAAEAGAISKMGHVVPEDLYNLYEELIQRMPHRIAGTAFRTMTDRLATAGGDKTRIEGLKMLGLKPTDVDFAPDAADAKAESYTDVMERLEAGGAKLSEQDRNIAYEKVFGVEGKRAALALVTPGIGQRMRDKALAMNDPAALQRAFDTSVTNNEAAQLRAAEARKKIAMDVPGATDRERIGLQLEAAAAERVARGEISAGQAGLAKERYDKLVDHLGVSPQKAASIASRTAAFSYFDFFGSNDEQVAKATADNRPKTYEQLEEIARRPSEQGWLQSIFGHPVQNRVMRQEAIDAQNELDRRNRLVPDRPAQPAANEGAAVDLSPLLERLNVNIEKLADQLATNARQPQKLILESGGRTAPARKAVQSFNTGSVG